MKTSVHITSVHPRNDVRITFKECVSLSKAGYDVTLLVADGKGYERNKFMTFVDFGKPVNRIHRMIVVVSRMLIFCLRKDANVFHIHDPELLFLGLALTLQGKKVIFDVHEDVEMQIKNKPYIYPFLAPAIASIYRFIEVLISRKFSGVIAATPTIEKKFKKISNHTKVIFNFPIFQEFDGIKRDVFVKGPWICCYVGAITEGRGALEIVQAAQKVRSDVKFVFMGRLDDDYLRSKMEELDVNKRVSIEPHGSRAEVKSLIEKSVIGLCLFRPDPNHINSLPNKLFEYMSAGLCSLISNFESWEKLVADANAGITCDGSNPKEIAEKIDFLLSDTASLKSMGRNGMKAVEKKYNWNFEEKKLIDFYEALELV